MVDEFTKEALAMEVGRSITVNRIIDVIGRLVVTHGAREHLRIDNGPELLSWALRDWSQALEDREHPSLLGSEPWPGHLTVEHVELLVARPSARGLWTGKSDARARADEEFVGDR
jgi:hypothetical protein